MSLNNKTKKTFKNKSVLNILWPLAIIIASLALAMSSQILFSGRTTVKQISSTSQLSPVTADNADEQPNQVPLLLDDECTAEQCLIEWPYADIPLIGLATISGYYVEEERTDNYGDKDEQVTCDRFVITGGSQPLINHFTNLAFAMGDKPFYNLNNLQQPVINIDLESLSVPEKRIVTNTGPKNEIKLSVIHQRVSAHGARVCFSFVEAVAVHQGIN